MKAAQHDGSDEMALSEEVSEAHLMRHARKIARWIRLSGSREEREAFLYLKGELEALDLEPTLYDHPAYISLPVSASLTIVAPRREEIACITHSAGASTGPDGVEGDVMYAGAGVPADFAGRDVRGKIALADWARRWEATTVGLAPGTRNRRASDLRNWILPEVGAGIRG